MTRADTGSRNRESLELVRDLPMFMSLDEVAEFLGFSTRTLRRWKERGHLKVLRTSRRGGRVRVSRSEVARLITKMLRTGRDAHRTEKTRSRRVSRRFKDVPRRENP